MTSFYTKRACNGFRIQIKKKRKQKEFAPAFDKITKFCWNRLPAMQQKYLIKMKKFLLTKHLIGLSQK